MNSIFTCPNCHVATELQEVKENTREIEEHEKKVEENRQEIKNTEIENKQKRVLREEWLKLPAIERARAILGGYKPPEDPDLNNFDIVYWNFICCRSTPFSHYIVCPICGFHHKFDNHKFGKTRS